MEGVRCKPTNYPDLNEGHGETPITGRASMEILLRTGPNVLLDPPGLTNMGPFAPGLCFTRADLARETQSPVGATQANFHRVTMEPCRESAQIWAEVRRMLNPFELHSMRSISYGNKVSSSFWGKESHRGLKQRLLSHRTRARP